MDLKLGGKNESIDLIVFVGDANADEEGAPHVGAHFVYFPSEANPPLAPTPTDVSDLRELLVERG